MYRFSALDDQKNIKYAISTVLDGNQSFKYGSEKEVAENRKRFLSKSGINIDDCATFIIVHGNKIMEVGEENRGVGMKSSKFSPKCDGFVTKTKGLYLYIKVADCAPVVVYDPKKEVLGMVHIGWKNVENNTLDKLVKICKNRFGSNVKNMKLYIGPHAGPDKYIVEAPSQVNKIEWKPFLHKVKNSGSYKVDFIGYFKSQAILLGIEENNIFESEVDTIKDHRFYSHYRFTHEGGLEGRFAMVCGMEE